MNQVKFRLGIKSLSYKWYFKGRNIILPVFVFFLIVLVAWYLNHNSQIWVLTNVGLFYVVNLQISNPPLILFNIRLTYILRSNFHFSHGLQIFFLSLSSPHPPVFSFILFPGKFPFLLVITIFISFSRPFYSVSFSSLYLRHFIFTPFIFLTLFFFIIFLLNTLLPSCMVMVIFFFFFYPH